MTFLNPAASFRWILPTETDANSPLSEELMSQYRENGEAAQLGIIDSGRKARVTNNGSGSNVLTVEKIVNTDPSWLANELVQLMMVVVTGNAIGLNYVIAANTQLDDLPDTATITVTGANFQADGIVVGDEIKILFRIVNHGHTHDGLNSMPLAVSSLVLSENSTFNTGVLTTNWVETWDTFDFQMWYDTGARFLSYALEHEIISTQVTAIMSYIEIPAQTVTRRNGTTYSFGGAVSPTLTTSKSTTTNKCSIKALEVDSLDLGAAGLEIDEAYMFRIMVKTTSGLVGSSYCSQLKVWSM